MSEPAIRSDGASERASEHDDDEHRPDGRPRAAAPAPARAAAASRRHQGGTAGRRVRGLPSDFR